MTMFDDEFDRIFKRMSGSFFDIDDIFEEFKKNDSNTGPIYYGYTMTVGPNGKPVLKEYGNVKPGLLPTSDNREPIVDVIVDEKEKQIAHRLCPPVGTRLPPLKAQSAPAKNSCSSPMVSPTNTSTLAGKALRFWLR